MTLLLALAACGSKRKANDDAAPAAGTAETAGVSAPATPAITGCPACEAGPCTPADAVACHRLAQDYAHANGVPFDLSKHAHYLKLACDRDMADACSALALLYQDGRAGMPHDDAKAAELHQKACEAGAGVGCFNLAMMHEAGGIGVADPSKAAPWYERAVERYSSACNANDHQWCMNLGVMYENGYGVPADPARAVALYEKGCKGSRESCVNLALMTMRGAGVAKDPARAIAMLQTACDEGTLLACGSLGQAYVRGDYTGTEGPPDPGAAFPLLTKSCNGYIGFACGLLSILYELGQGVPKDFAKGLELADLACSLGRDISCLGMAEKMFALHTPEGDAKTREMLTRGCNIGDAQQCAQLGVMFATGAGGLADADLALAAYTEGCRRGDLRACGLLAQDGHPLPVLPARAPEIYAKLCEGGVQPACAHAPR